MNSLYHVAFTDIYPWVWSVMLGATLMLADRRGAFKAAGTHSPLNYKIKNFWAIVLNVITPTVLFALSMTNVGPNYPYKMDFMQILGVLFLATSPLGSHQLWITVARWRGWMPSETLPDWECEAHKMVPYGSIFWTVLLLPIQVLVAIFGYPLPY